MSEEVEVSAAELAEQYIRIRDKRDELKAAYSERDKKLEERMDALTAQMLVLCETTQATSIRTDAGTIIQRTETSFSTTNWDTVYEVINEYDAPWLLWKRINNTAMKEFLAENPDVYPAGLNVENKRTLMVRRPSKKV